MSRSESNLRWPITIGCIVLIVPIIVALVLFVRFAQNSFKPLPQPSKVIMPNPNAYDFYVQAGKLITDTEKLDKMVEQMKKPEERSYTVQPNERDYTSSERYEFVKQNAPALKKLREGFEYDCRHPNDRIVAPSFKQHPEYKDFRRLARLLAFEGEQKAANNDWAGASQSYFDIIRFGQDVQRGGAILPMLVGRAIQNIGRRQLYTTIDHLNAKEARKSAEEMEKALARQTPFVETLIEEKWVCLAMLQGLEKQVPYNKQNLPGLGLFARHSANNYARYMDKCIENARQPYASKPPEPEPPKGILAGILAPVGSKAMYVAVSNDAHNASLAVQFALQAYKMEHGQYPETLNELAPNYLIKIPNDPFTVKRPLQYRKTGDKYILYSIGPDLTDDGGKPVDNPKTEPDKRYVVDKDSKGDIVAGINR